LKNGATLFALFAIQKFQMAAKMTQYRTGVAEQIT
jgi:hypothetical protein